VKEKALSESCEPRRSVLRRVCRRVAVGLRPRVERRRSGHHQGQDQGQGHYGLRRESCEAGQVAVAQAW